MKGLKTSIVIASILGISALGHVAHANSGNDKSAKKDKSLTSVILSFFGKDNDKKDTNSEILLIKKPTGDPAEKYITLSEPTEDADFKQQDKKITVSQSFAVKPSLIFNMGRTGLAASPYLGFSASNTRSTGNQITFSYGNGSQPGGGDSLDISLGSQFLIEPLSVLSPLYDGSSYEQINNRQVYNLSLDVGYAGFKVGASFSREKMLHDSGMSGFDVGLGYAGKSWGADVKFGGYKRERDLFFSSTEDFYNTVYALEIGAAYQIRNNIHFTGRFTYYSYGQENNLDKLKNSQVFFLGTNVNF